MGTPSATLRLTKPTINAGAMNPADKEAAAAGGLERQGNASGPVSVSVGVCRPRLTLRPPGGTPQG
jgi:hypothetical protein